MIERSLNRWLIDSGPPGISFTWVFQGLILKRSFVEKRDRNRGPNLPTIRSDRGEEGIIQNNVDGYGVLYKDSYDCHGWAEVAWKGDGSLIEDYYNGEFDPGSG